MALGNIFKTKEEARFQLERRRIDAIFRKYSNEFRHGEDNHTMYVDDNKIYFCCDEYTQDSNYVFDSIEQAQKVVDEIGEEKLLKYWFGRYKEIEKPTFPEPITVNEGFSLGINK